MKRSLPYFALSLLFIVLDQITKYLCVAYIPYNTMGIEVLPVFNLVHVYNHGAAFSLFADWGGAQRYFLMFVAVALVALFAVLLCRADKSDRYLCLSYALFIGGAVGNLIDRVLHGYVIDFLLFYLKDANTGEIYWSYPAFNVADISVFCGAVLMVLLSLFSGSREAQKSGGA